MGTGSPTILELNRYGFLKHFPLFLRFNACISNKVLKPKTENLRPYLLGLRIYCVAFAYDRLYSISRRTIETCSDRLWCSLADRSTNSGRSSKILSKMWKANPYRCTILSILRMASRRTKKKVECIIIVQP